GAAEGPNRDEAQSSEKAHAGIEDARHAEGLHVLLQDLHVLFDELFDLLVLPSEGLHHTNAGNRIAEHGVHIRNTAPYPVVDAMHTSCKLSCSKEHERCRQEGDKRQFPVEVEQEDRNEHQGQNVDNDLLNLMDHKMLQEARVVCDPRHDPTRLTFVVEL